MTTPQQNQKRFDGNILLFYAFDVGDDIDLAMIEKKGLVPAHNIPQSSYFKNYHKPLSFYLESKDEVQNSDCVTSKVHHFGVLSFVYRIPFHSSLEQLKQDIGQIKASFDKRSEDDARTIFENIKPAISTPVFFNLTTDYFAIHVNPTADKMEPLEFKDTYGSKIASLLRLETKVLSQFQEDAILDSTIGYYGQDLIIIDGESSFIYDDEYFEAMEFMESVNIQQLELQYFDRLLDTQLDRVYKQPHFHIPWTAYVPLMGRKLNAVSSELARLSVDISVVTRRLENSIKILNDTYYSQVYSILIEKLSLQEWRDSIQGKLDIIKDLYQVHQNRLDTIHGEILEVIIVALITFEIVLAFVK